MDTAGARRNASAGEAFPGQNAQAAVTQAATRIKVRNDQRYFARDLGKRRSNRGAVAAIVVGISGDCVLDFRICRFDPVWLGFLR